MKITVTGSLGNISRTLTGKLVANGHEVNVISSNPERAKEIEAMKAIPLIGSVEDSAFIKKSFQGSDAVYLMIPPNSRTAAIKQYIKNVGALYTKAVKETGIRYVVNLSSIGAHIPNDLGPTGANYFVEQQLNELDAVHILHLRPGLFMSNFYGAMETIKHQDMLGNNFEGSVKLPLTHPADIAAIAFEALDKLSFYGKQAQYIVSDEKNGFEIAKTLGRAIGKPDVKWMAFSDEELCNALVQNGFSAQMANVYMVEIGIALRDGSLMKDYQQHGLPLVGQTTLQDFAQEFAMAYPYNK